MGSSGGGGDGRRGRKKESLKVEREELVVTGAKRVEGGAQVMRAGCERVESWGEIWAQEGAVEGSRMGSGSVLWQRDRPASKKDLLGVGRGGTEVLEERSQVMGQSPL